MPPRAYGDTQEVLQRVRERDSEAWDTLMERYGSQLRILIRNKRRKGLAGPYPTADLLQSSMVTLFDEDRFSYSGPGSLLRWLRTIVKHKLFDKLRRQSSQVHQSLDQAAEGGTDALLPTDPAPGPLELAAEADQLAAILGALDQLPREDVELIQMRIFDRMKTSEIATILGRPRTTVTKQMSDAIGRLREKVRHLE